MTPCVLDQKSLLCAEAELALANRSAGGHSMKDTQYLAYERIKILNFKRQNERRWNKKRGTLTCSLHAHIMCWWSKSYAGSCMYTSSRIGTSTMGGG